MQTPERELYLTKINDMIKKVEGIRVNSGQQESITCEGDDLLSNLNCLFKLSCQPTEESINSNETKLFDQYDRLIDQLGRVDQLNEPSKKFECIPQQLSKTNRAEKIKRFINLFCKNNNVDLSSIEVKPTDANGKSFGVFTTRDVAFGETLFTVPAAAMIIVDDIYEACSDGELKNLILADPLLKTMKNVLLSFYILLEYYKKNESKYADYLRTLPGFANNACYFERRHFERLRGSPLLFSAFNIFKGCVRQYAYLHMRLINYNESKWISEVASERFCFEDYRWAVGIVMTRANDLPSSLLNKKSQGNNLALIPVLDMCNHKPVVYSIDYDEAGKKCVVLTPEILKKGSEFCIFYGHRPSSLLFLHNGFLPENNANDFVLFECDFVMPQNGVAVMSEKEKLLVGLFDRIGVSYGRQHFPLGLKDPWNGSLRALIRGVCCSEEEVGQLLKESTNENVVRAFFGETGVSQKSEERALKLFLTKIKLALKKYEEDFPNEDESDVIMSYCNKLVEMEKSFLRRNLEIVQKLADTFVN